MTFAAVALSPRALVCWLLVALGAWANARHVPHHAGANPFEVLYAHLLPENLVPAGAHGVESHGEAAGAAGATGTHYLLSLPLPGWLAFFDMDGAAPGAQLVLTNLQIFQVLAVLLIAVAFAGVPAHLRHGRGDPLTRVAAGFALYVRDEMVYSVMGREHGRRFLPWFLSLFFFILFMNLCGLVPGAVTATASIFVTGALAMITFASMIACGMAVQGPIAFWKNLVPHVPLALLPLMAVVELIGLAVKPVALMIRLFANMTGGHMVVLSFMGLIFLFGGRSPAVGWSVAPVAVGFAVFIMIIESFVAMLQAYIFTYLSILFVNLSVHPEH